MEVTDHQTHLKSVTEQAQGLVNEINQLENKDYDMIINFAAESHVDNSISDPVSFVRTNTLGTLSLLNYANSKILERFLQLYH